MSDIIQVHSFTAKGHGYTTLEVLSFLKGRKLDDVVKSALCSLRPSEIRVCTTGCTADSHLWRVTIYLTPEETINRIEQEVQIGSFGSIRSGYDFNMELRASQSPQ